MGNKSTKVRFIGCTVEQMRWGNNDNPNEALVENEIYEVEIEEVHSWHTKIKLVGIDGNFNSVCFEEVEDGKHI